MNLIEAYRINLLYVKLESECMYFWAIRVIIRLILPDCVTIITHISCCRVSNSLVNFKPHDQPQHTPGENLTLTLVLMLKFIRFFVPIVFFVAKGNFMP